MFQMPRGQGVSVKDVNQHEFVRAFAAFLKKWAMILWLIIIKISYLCGSEMAILASMYCFVSK